MLLRAAIVLMVPLHSLPRDRAAPQALSVAESQGKPPYNLTKVRALWPWSGLAIPNGRPHEHSRGEFPFCLTHFF